MNACMYNTNIIGSYTFLITSERSQFHSARCCILEGSRAPREIMREEEVKVSRMFSLLLDQPLGVHIFLQIIGCYHKNIARAPPSYIIRSSPSNPLQDSRMLFLRVLSSILRRTVCHAAYLTSTSSAGANKQTTTMTTDDAAYYLIERYRELTTDKPDNYQSFMHCILL
jgi:hypothetical protein